MVMNINPASWFRAIKPAAKRMFQAAMPGRLTGSWLMLPQPTNWVVRSSLRALRARSREQWENNPYVKRFTDLIASNVVGQAGIVAHPIVRKPRGALDDAVNDLIYSAYCDWGQDRHCDAAHTLSWADMQRLVIKTVAIDGEAFVMLLRNRAFKYGFALKLIDPEYIDLLYEQTLPGGSYIMQGIEFNVFDEPTAYYVYEPAPGDSMSTYAPTGAGKHLRVPAANMLHVFNPFRIGQKRGLPMTSTALEPLKMLNGYMEAAVVAARVGAATMGILKTVGGEEETLSDHKGQSGQLSFDAEPGTFRQLPDGVDLETFKPEYPTAAFQPFVKVALRQIASALGVSYSSLSNDIESVNYSSIRQDALQDRELYRLLTDSLITQLIKPVYHAWLDVQLEMGALGQIDENKWGPYKSVRFAPRPFHSIDPQKDANAQALQINQGIRSRSDVIRHEFGQEPDDVWAEIAQENAKMKALGLNFAAQQVTEEIRENL
ncbi:MAG: phage portal protein [Patescibacteria group bacterium]|nr:phage portal protein [Patescibacteria group bacterium]